MQKSIISFKLLLLNIVIGIEIVNDTNINKIIQNLKKAKYKGIPLPHTEKFSGSSQLEKHSIIPGVSHGKLQQLQNFVCFVNC